MTLSWTDGEYQGLTASVWDGEMTSMRSPFKNKFYIWIWDPLKFKLVNTSKKYYVRAKDAKRSMWGDGHDVRWSYCERVVTMREGGANDQELVARDVTAPFGNAVEIVFL